MLRLAAALHMSVAKQDGGIGYAQFIIENTGKITEHYQLVRMLLLPARFKKLCYALQDKKKLGEGSYGSVTKATNISTKAGSLTCSTVRMRQRYADVV